MKKLSFFCIILFVISCSKDSDSGSSPETPPTQKFKLTVTSGDNGSVNSVGGSYDVGTEITITATPDPEFNFERWTGTEVSTSNPLTFILENDENIVANFIKKQYQLAVNIEGGGTVSEDIVSTGKATDYDSGTTVKLTALPFDEWIFVGWTGAVESTEGVVEITMKNAKEVTATFIIDNTYDYLTYGDQDWTVENARMVTYRDGTPIPEVSDATQWNSLTTGAWSYYNNDPTKPRLYNWYAVMGIYDAASLSDPSLRKEFAPVGWHVPSDTEWSILEEYLISSGYNYDGTTTGNKIGKSMASTSGWGVSTVEGAVGNDPSLNNSSGFNAFPVGIRVPDGFMVEGNNAVIWTSSENEDNPNFAWYRNIGINRSWVLRTNNIKNGGWSVRFVRD